MDAGMKFFSKMLDDNNKDAIRRYGLSKNHFSTQDERIVFDWIDNYIKRNGNAPSKYEIGTALPDEFTYIPQVNAPYEDLVNQINADFIRDEMVRVLQGKAYGTDDETQTKKVTLQDIISDKPGDQALDWLMDQLEKIKQNTNTGSIGKSIKDNPGWFLDEYDRRKEGKSFKVWESRFPTMNEILGGGYAGGNMYVPFARSGRGKSIFCIEEAVEAARQGATVLIWALEMIAFEMYCRIYSSLSAREGLFTKTIKGIDYSVGFDQKAMMMAKLDDEFYEGLKTFLECLPELLPGNIIIRSVDDENFYKRDVRALEADIMQTGADFVIVDPVYYMDYERNTSNVAGGDVAATSRKLRRLAGSTGVVLFAVTQADETKEQYDEDGDRYLMAPKRNEMKKSKQLLEDSSMSIGWDSLDERAIIVPGKTRTGGEGEKIELVFLPNNGLIREAPSVDEIKDYFKP